METVDFTTSPKITLPCDYASDIVLFSGGELSSCVKNNVSLDYVL